MRREGHAPPHPGRPLGPRAERIVTGLSSSPGRRLASAAGAVIAVGSLAGAAAMLGHSMSGPAGSSAADGGFPGQRGPGAAVRGGDPLAASVAGGGISPAAFNPTFTDPGRVGGADGATLARPAPGFTAPPPTTGGFTPGTGLGGSGGGGQISSSSGGGSGGGSGGAVGNTLDSAVGGVGGTVGGTVSDLGHAVGGPLGGTVAGLGQTVGDTTEALGGAVNTTVGTVGTVANTGVHAVAGTVDGTGRALGGTVDALGSALPVAGPTVSALGSGVEQTTHGVGKVLTGTADGLVDGLIGGAPDSRRLLATPTESFRSAGRSNSTASATGGSALSTLTDPITSRDADNSSVRSVTGEVGSLVDTDARPGRHAADSEDSGDTSDSDGGRHAAQSFRSSEGRHHGSDKDSGDSRRGKHRQSDDSDGDSDNDSHGGRHSRDRDSGGKHSGGGLSALLGGH
jgi:hypothetical protein